MSQPEEISIADDALNGVICSQCLIPFVSDNGFPVLCQECWAEHRKECKVKRDKREPQWSGICKCGLQESLFETV